MDVKFTKSLTILAFILMLSSFASKAELSSKLEVTEYPLTANNLAELVKALKSNGPKFGKRSVWAVIQWDLTVQYRYRTVSGKCHVVTESIDVVGDISLPNWSDIDSKSESIQTWWQEFYQFIKAHETLHYDNVVNHAKWLKTELENSTGFDTCDLARQHYLRKKYEAIQLITEVDRSIDRKAKVTYSNNSALFEPLRAVSGGLVIQSGFMNSYIGL